MKAVKIYLISFLLMVLPLRASADLNGNWIGWAKWNFEGSGTDCRLAQFKYQETVQSIHRKLGTLDCDYVSQSYSELLIEKRNNSELWFNQKIIGSFKNNIYDWVETYSPTVTIQVHAEINGDAMTYLEKWTDHKGQSIYDIQSRLFRK